jgi:hypothetical protein
VLELRVRDVLNPFTFAVHVFLAVPIEDDDLMTKVGMSRSILGMVLIIFFCLPYSTETQTAGSLVDNWYGTALVAGAVTIVATLPFGVISSKMGRAYFRKFGWQAPSRAIAYCGAIAIFVYLCVDDEWWTGTLYGFLIWAFVIWLFVFITIGIFLNATFVFGVSNTHPKLGPVVSSVTVVILTVQNLMNIDSALTPRSVTLLIVLSGAVSTVLLSGVEYYLLSAKGYTLRGAPRTYKRVTKKNLGDAIRGSTDYSLVTRGSYQWFARPEGRPSRLKTKRPGTH